MTRAIGVLATVGALLLSLQVGSAQQTPAVRFTATTADQLRSWDASVTARERTGELQVTQVATDPSLPSRSLERLQQYHDGVPIWGAQVVRDSDRGVPVSIFGEMAVPPDVDTRPGLAAEVAGRVFRTQVLPGAILLRPVELVILALGSGEHRLAYTAVVSGASQVLRVFVDAGTGAELLRYSEIHTQAAVGTGRGLVGDTKKLSVLQQAGTFRADDQHRPPVLTTFDMRGDLTRALDVSFAGTPLFVSDIASDADNDWTDVAAVDAHVYVEWTYDYYFKRHGRRGLNNADRPLVALVNPVTPQAAVMLSPELLFNFAVNAFWCDACGPGGVGVMFFGNGIPTNFTLGGQNVLPLAGSLDVVAHELSHGVISSSSDLIYMNESGALNEAFSDIMGTAVEFFFQPAGSGFGQADFLMGEDSFRSPFGGGLNGIRSLVNPLAFGDPDHYSIRFTGSADDGGVHINSGIVNQAFYLAVQGGTNGTSRLAVQGVGLANREQIERAYYRAFVFLLPSSATFSTARAATIQAARDLYGATSAAATAITQAWTAVGVN
jgi:thermolysin